MIQRKVDQEKIKKILIKRGYKDGNTPRGYEVHHIKPVEEGGKDTPRNIRVVKRSKHIKIHANRKKLGKIWSLEKADPDKTNCCKNFDTRCLAWP